MWDVNTHKCLATLVGHNGAVRALAASDNIVFSGSDDTTIRVRAGLVAMVKRFRRDFEEIVLEPG